MSILGAMWFGASNDADYWFVSVTSGKASVASGLGRKSSSDALSTPSGSALYQCMRILDAPESTLSVAMAVNPQSASYSTDPAIFSFTNNISELCTVYLLRADGTIQVKRGSTVIAASNPGYLPIGSYHHVEAKMTFHSSAGAGEVWVDGESVLSFSGAATAPAGVTTATVFFIGYRNTTTNQGIVGHIDDVIWGTDRIGDRRVDGLVVSGAGSNADFTPSTGANYQNVDEAVPDGDTTYNESATAGDTDSFAQAGLSFTPAAIDAVIVEARGRNDIIGSGSLAALAVSGGTVAVATERWLGTLYQSTRQLIMETDPDTGAAWTLSGVNALEIGYRKVS